MDEYKFLKQEEKLCSEMWEQNYQENKSNDVTLNHAHICDFDLVNLLYHGYSKSRAKKTHKRGSGRDYMLAYRL